MACPDYAAAIPPSLMIQAHGGASFRFNAHRQLFAPYAFNPNGSSIECEGCVNHFGPVAVM